MYDNGQELYPSGSVVYKEITREAVDRAMEVLAVSPSRRTGLLEAGP
jgi:hypothetical protein